MLANTTAGVQWQVILVLACITFIIAMLFMGFLGRRYMMGKEIHEEQMEPSSSFLGKMFNPANEPRAGSKLKSSIWL